jgi:hypothetical protein
MVNASQLIVDLNLISRSLKVIDLISYHTLISDNIGSRIFMFFTDVPYRKPKF